MEPDALIARDANVRVEMRDGSELRGQFLRQRATVDSVYTERLASAIRSDSTLGSVPSPGETIRVDLKSRMGEFRVGAFRGVSGPDRPGLQVELRDGSLGFISQTDIRQVRFGHGAPVDLRRMYASVRAGSIPAWDDSETGRLVDVMTTQGAVALNAGEIERIVLTRKRNVGVALAVGLAIDIGILFLTARALDRSFDDMTYFR
jgi:hypothetical protein